MRGVIISFWWFFNPKQKTWIIPSKQNMYDGDYWELYTEFEIINNRLIFQSRRRNNKFIDVPDYSFDESVNFCPHSSSNIIERFVKFLEQNKMYRYIFAQQINFMYTTKQAIQLLKDEQYIKLLQGIVYSHFLTNDERIRKIIQYLPIDEQNIVFEDEIVQ